MNARMSYSNGSSSSASSRHLTRTLLFSISTRILHRYHPDRTVFPVDVTSSSSVATYHIDATINFDRFVGAGADTRSFFCNADLRFDLRAVFRLRGIVN